MPAFRFKTLEAAVPDPGEFLLLDFAKFDRPPAIHVGMLALNAFEVPACVRVIPSLCVCTSTLANAERVSANHTLRAQSFFSCSPQCAPVLSWSCIFGRTELKGTSTVS